MTIHKKLDHSNKSDMKLAKISDCRLPLQNVKNFDI